MPVLNSPISRIYTPPTCTLEVTAQPSALSRWTRTPTIKSLWFLLSFDGMTHETRDPIEVRGNQTQLAVLSETVTEYIQTLLASRYRDLSSPNALQSLATAETVAPSIKLQPRSLVAHELTLGSLATERSGPSVILKVSQLYDLATALEHCAADLQQLPTAASSNWRSSIPLLAKSAAVLLFTVGIGTVVTQLLQPRALIVNQAERSPNSITALAPPASPPSSKPLPSLKSSPSNPLKLPNIQLPSRSPNAPISSSSSARAKNHDAELFSSLHQSVQKSGSQPPKTPEEPSLLNTLPGAVASLPTPAIRPLNRAQPGTSLTEGSTTSNGNNQDRVSSQALESAPNAVGQSVGQSTLFDTIPQVAEVRDYVAARWQPTPPPPKTVEYQLTLNPNGSLATVEPLGASAQQYLDKLPLPQLRAPFVSAIELGGQPTVRLVVRPDGTVQTFLDAGR